jgi:hypothetical protein
MMDLVKEFLTLDYKPGQKKEGIKDIVVKDNLIIIRIEKLSTKVIFLYNGAYISIGSIWIDLFGSLSIWGGDCILNEYGTDLVDKFTRSMIDLINTINTGYADQKILKVVEDICRFGTTPFIKWCKDEGFTELAESLKPFEFGSIDKNFEI